MHARETERQRERERDREREWTDTHTHTDFQTVEVLMLAALTDDAGDTIFPGKPGKADFPSPSIPVLSILLGDLGTGPNCSYP